MVANTTVKNCFVFGFLAGTDDGYIIRKKEEKTNCVLQFEIFTKKSKNPICCLP